MIRHDLISMLRLEDTNPRIQAILRQHELPESYLVATDDIELAMTNMTLHEEVRGLVQEGLDRLDDHDSLWQAMTWIRWLTVEHAHPSEWLVKQTPISEMEPSPGWLEVGSLLVIAGYQIRHLREAGIEEQHIAFNLNHLTNYINGHYKTHRVLGTGNFTWCIYLASIGLIHLHTLHFMHHVMNDPLVMLRHKKSRHVVMLAMDGIRVRPDGQISGTNGIEDVAFTTVFQETEHTIHGHLVNPYGAITSEMATFDLAEYDVALRQKDATIDFHIPTGPGYNIADTKRSFEEAIQVFTAMHPTQDYKAFWCTSWLYSPQIPLFLSKQDGNIATINNQSYTFPATAGEGSLFEFVFHDKTIDIHQVEPKTSLERDIVSYYDQGGRINAGTFLYLLEDLDEFGTAPYRNEDQKRTFLAMQER